MKLKKINNKIIFIVLILLLILLSFNLYKFFCHKKIQVNYMDIDEINLGKIENFKTINKIGKTNYNLLFTYIYNISDCHVCIYNLYRSVKRFVLINNSNINILIVFNNFNEVKEYCDNYYSNYYKQVNFYYCTNDQFERMNIKYTPFLIVEKNGKKIFGYHFGSDLKPLWKISKKYLK